MTEMSGAILLEARQLTLWRGDEPLFEDVSLTVHDGELLQIEGSNGAGKTTLLKVLCGLLLPEEGEVLWQQSPIRHSDSTFASQMIFLGHKPGLKPELTAIENLRALARLRSTDTDSLDSRITAALERLQLGHKMELPCQVLSAGQRRRVALARLLVERARLWILDEPLTALDQQGRDCVQQLMREHLQRDGAIVYTTHQPLSAFAGQSTRVVLSGVTIE